MKMSDDWEELTVQWLYRSDTFLAYPPRKVVVRDLLVIDIWKDRLSDGSDVHS